jgi:hypothetical protein
LEINSSRIKVQVSFPKQEEKTLEINNLFFFIINSETKLIYIYIIGVRFFLVVHASTASEYFFFWKEDKS